MNKDTTNKGFWNGKDEEVDDSTHSVYDILKDLDDTESSILETGSHFSSIMAKSCGGIQTTSTNILPSIISEEPGSSVAESDAFEQELGASLEHSMPTNSFDKFLQNEDNFYDSDASIMTMSNMDGQKQKQQKAKQKQKKSFRKTSLNIFSGSEFANLACLNSKQISVKIFRPTAKYGTTFECI